MWGVIVFRHPSPIILASRWGGLNTGASSRVPPLLTRPAPGDPKKYGGRDFRVYLDLNADDRVLLAQGGPVVESNRPVIVRIKVVPEHSECASSCGAVLITIAPPSNQLLNIGEHELP